MFCSRESGGGEGLLKCTLRGDGPGSQLTEQIGGTELAPETEMEALKGPGRENQGGPGLRKGFWPGEFHGLYSPWGPKELDRTERLSLRFILQR